MLYSYSHSVQVCPMTPKNIIQCLLGHHVRIPEKTERSKVLQTRDLYWTLTIASDYNHLGVRDKGFFVGGQFAGRSEH